LCKDEVVEGMSLLHLQHQLDQALTVINRTVPFQLLHRHPLVPRQHHLQPLIVQKAGELKVSAALEGEALVVDDPVAEEVRQHRTVHLEVVIRLQLNKKRHRKKALLIRLTTAAVVQEIRLREIAVSRDQQVLNRGHHLIDAHNHLHNKLLRRSVG
jgi:hypothetical protein